MSVETFDPGASKPSISDDDLARLLTAAVKLDLPDFGLSAGAVAGLARLARHPDADWQQRAGDLSDDDAVALIRFFTLAEARFPAWEAGAKSPVIPLVAELKKRGGYPQELTRWIKGHTDNRFLPYGSLLDRL